MWTSVLLFGIFAVAATVAATETTDSNRIDCYPDSDRTGMTQDECESRGCVYNDATTTYTDEPWCYFDDTYGYVLTEDVDTDREQSFRATLRRATSDTMFGGDYDEIYADFEYQSDSRLRVKIWDGSGDRYEVPLSITSKYNAHNPLYSVRIVNETTFSFQVIRKSTNTVLFDSSLGGFTFADQFLQISTALPSSNVYGLGENEQYTFKIDFTSYYDYAFYARDQPPAGTCNMYGTHPHYTVLESDGNAHGVLFLNSNAQEFSIFPNPGFVYRTIGGILDIYFFLGPTPENTVQQYTEAVGRAPIPPYWSLGFQICRYGYTSTEAIETVVNRTAYYGIPQDVQYADIDIMNSRLDFTIDETNFGTMPEYVEYLKQERGIKFATILDPGISTGIDGYTAFDLGDEMDVWVKMDDASTPAAALVWPDNPVYFVDFSKDAAHAYWTEMLIQFQDLIKYDAIWIDMNEPSNFVDGDDDSGTGTCDYMNTLNSPPYLPHIIDELYSKTLCPTNYQEAGLHYNVHSLYGWFESRVTHEGVQIATKKRGLVLSRSTFPGSGKWASHWLGDNTSNWPNLQHSLIGILQFNHFGIPMAGADICGFNDDSTADLCQRWQEAGAFYPFSRNHNTIDTVDQDPGVWGEDVAASSRTALLIRYRILPYIYTLFYHHHVDGNTVARALWHEFPTDSNTYSIDQQFLLGSGFLVSPVTEEGATTKDAYFPDTRWYDYYTGKEVNYRGDTVVLSAPMEFIPLHIRGGVIIPTQDPAVNTVLSRQNPLGLIVALDDDYYASGTLYYDDGDVQNPVENGYYYLARFEVVNGHILIFDVLKNGYSGMSDLVIDTIYILGAENVGIVALNDATIDTYTLDDSTKVLNVTDLGLSPVDSFILDWDTSAKPVQTTTTTTTAPSGNTTEPRPDVVIINININIDEPSKGALNISQLSVVSLVILHVCLLFNYFHV